MAEETKSKGGKVVGNIIFVLFILGVGGFLGYTFLFGKTDDPILARQLTAEEGLKVYLDVADGFKSEKYNFEDVRKCVTESDWQWFQANAESSFESSGVNQLAGISSGADPTQVAAIARRVFMQDALTFGPYGDKATIVEREESGNDAAFVVWKAEYYTESAVYYHARVRLTKEGKYWKVKDFAGARAKFENRLADEDYLEVGSEVFQKDGTVLRTGLTPDGGSNPAADSTALAASAPADAGASPPIASTAPSGDALPSFGEPADAGALPSFGEPVAQPASTTGLPSFGDAPAAAATTNTAAAEPFGSGPPPASDAGGFAPLDAGGSLNATEDEARTELASASRKWSQMRYVEALEHGKRALDIRKQLYGPSDPRTMEAQRMVDAASRTLGL